MVILGISAFYHDSAAALIKDGRVLYAVQEERFSRKKNDAAFPEQAILWCLSEAGLGVEDIDIISFYDKPFLKFERLLETYYAFAPKGFWSFSKAMPLWLKEKLFTKQLIRKRIKALSGVKRLKIPIHFPEHHCSHLASAFYTSPFKKSAFLTVDGVGEWATTCYGIACGKTGIHIMGELHFPDSLGLLYSSFTYFLGFKVNSGEYKMMGLAPYARRGNERTHHFKNLITTYLLTVKGDGSFQLNMEYFTYASGLKMVDALKWEQLFGVTKREPEENLNQVHADLALAAQEILEEILIRIVRFVKTETGMDFLCLAGGVALNCVANSRLYNERIFKDIYIQPAAGDAGGAMGAALTSAYLASNLDFTGLDTPFDIYLGPRFSNFEIERVIRKYALPFQYYEDQKKLLEKTAEYLTANKVVGWFQGRTEFGPRALGNRSILAAANDAAMQQTLNMKIKFREGFRPFAPAICEEDYDTYFEGGRQSPYMLFTSTIREEWRKRLPKDFENFDLDQKRSVEKSQFPAITHIDYSARVQAVSRDLNPLFWSLLQQYKSVSGSAMLINTSFNVKDEPIVNTPEDAYHCFMNSGIDVLILGNYLIVK